MSIQQTKKYSDLEKRLKILKQQVYGKNSEDKYISISVDQKKKTSDIPTRRYTDALISSDMSYLYKDLFKITILSTAALGLQFILFFLTRNNILSLKLF